MDLHQQTAGVIGADRSRGKIINFATIYASDLEDDDLYPQREDPLDDGINYDAIDEDEDDEDLDIDEDYEDEEDEDLDEDED